MTTTLPSDTIAVGDCIATMRAWPQASLDLIFADPPYNIGYQYDQYEDQRDDHEYIQWTRDWITCCADLLKPTGSLYILIGDEYAAEVRLHLKELERRKKLVFRNWLIWHYTFGQNCKAKFNRSHVHLFYAVGPGAFNAKIGAKGAVGTTLKLPFTFNREAIAVPSARQMVYQDLRANPGGKLPDDTWYLRPQQAIEERLEGLRLEGLQASKPQASSLSASGTPGGNKFFDPDGDTWYLARLCGTFKERQGWHPCQLPEALLERIIKVSSNPGDTVFDPFTGSGTTLAVAARMQRHWLGCELSAEYAAKADARIRHAAATGQTQTTTQQQRGIVRGRPKKKAEPHRSKGLFGK